MRRSSQDLRVRETRFEHTHTFTSGHWCVGEIRAVSVNQVDVVPFVRDIDVEQIRSQRVEETRWVIVVEGMNMVVFLRISLSVNRLLVISSLVPVVVVQIKKETTS